MWGHPDQAEGPRAFAEKREPEWQPPTVEAQGVTLADLLFAPATRTTDGAASCTPAGVDALAGRGAGPGRRPSPRRCAAAGVEPGQAVGVMLPNGAELVAALFGVWRAGGGVRAAQPAAHRAARSPHVAGARPVAGGASVVGGRASSRRADARTFDADVALVQFTSGTTGRPKPVLLTHSGVLTLLDGVIASSRRTRPPTGAPPARRADAEPHPGVAVAVGRHLPGAVRVPGRRAGRGHGRLRPARVRRRSCARFGIRSTVLPPAAMTMLADDERVTDLAPLRYVRSITAPLSPLPGAPLPRPLRHRRAQQLRPDRDRRRDRRLERGRLAGARRRQARRGRPARTPASRCASTTRATTAQASCRCARRRCSRATPTGPTSPTGSRPTAGSAPATSAASTTRASCGSRAGCRDMINRGGLEGLPGRGRGGAAPRRPTSPTSRSSACPTTAWARCRGRSSSPRRGVAPTSDGLSDYCRAAPGAVQGAGAVRAGRRAAPQRGGQGAEGASSGRLKGSHA